MQTEWKIFGILLIIGVIVLGALIGLSALTTQEEPEQVVEPTPPISIQKKEINTSDWQTYTNEEFGFEVKYPPLWNMIEGPEELTVLNDEFGESYLSLSFANRAVLGISFCGPSPQDGRCEVLQAANTSFIIDWGLEEAVAETDINGDLAMFVTLHKNTDDAREMFRQILSTFQFID